MKQFYLRTAPIILACTFVLLVAGAVKPVLAHGEGRTLQRGHVLVGACYLTIWTAPAILRTGEVHVEATVFNQDGGPAPTAQVQVMLTPHRQQAPLHAVQASPSAGMAGGMRTAAFNVQQAGQYRVTVLVTDEAGSGKVEFDVEIAHVPLLFQVLIYGQLLATLAAGIWILHKGATVWFGQRRPAAPTATSATRAL
jgi:hypothetical protein